MTNINYHCDSCDNGIVIVQKDIDFNTKGIRLTSIPCNFCEKSFTLAESRKLTKVSNLEKDLPTEESVRQFANELAQEGVYKTHEEIDAYVDGFNYLLEELKGENNG